MLVFALWCVVRCSLFVVRCFGVCSDVVLSFVVYGLMFTLCYILIFVCRVSSDAFRLLVLRLSVFVVWCFC